MEWPQQKTLQDQMWVSLETYPHDDPGTMSSNNLICKAGWTIKAMRVTSYAQQKITEGRGTINSNGSRSNRERKKELG